MCCKALQCVFPANLLCFANYLSFLPFICDFHTLSCQSLTNELGVFNMNLEEFEDEALTNLRRNLKMALTIRDMNMKAASEKAGLSINYIGSFLRGDIKISHANLLRICKVLDVPTFLMSRPEEITLARIRLYNTL